MAEQQRTPFSVRGTAPANRHLEAGKNIVFHNSLAAMLCTRDKVGFDIVKFSSLFIAAFWMVGFGWLVNFPLVTWLFGYGIARGDTTSLARFALLFLAVGLWLRHQRKAEKWNPDRPHAQSLGVSRFADFLPIPEPYVYRYIDPAITALAGALLRYRLHCPLLGFYLMVSAVCLVLVEYQLHQQVEANDWSLGDRKFEAERDGEVLKAMSGQGEARRSSRAAYGIPTGSDGLEDSIARRRRERAGKPREDDDDVMGGE